MRLTPILALALALGSAGCVYIPLGSVPKLDVSSLASGTRTAILTAKVSDGGYRTQAVIDPWVRQDIKVVVVKVFKLDGSSEKSVLQSGEKTSDPYVIRVKPELLDGAINIKNLGPKTTYRLRAQAFNSTDESEASLISDDASSFVDIEVTNDDRPIAATLPIKLVDRLFSGEATNSLDVTAGQLKNDATESIELEPTPSPLPV